MIRVFIVFYSVLTLQKILVRKMRDNSAKIVLKHVYFNKFSQNVTLTHNRNKRRPPTNLWKRNQIVVSVPTGYGQRSRINMTLDLIICICSCIICFIITIAGYDSSYYQQIYSFITNNNVLKYVYVSELVHRV